jgi:hypothetical protein
MGEFKEKLTNAGWFCELYMGIIGLIAAFINLSSPELLLDGMKLLGASFFSILSAIVIMKQKVWQIQVVNLMISGVLFLLIIQGVYWVFDTIAYFFFMLGSIFMLAGFEYDSASGGNFEKNLRKKSKNEPKWVDNSEFDSNRDKYFESNF